MALLSGDKQRGADCLRRALTVPMKCLAEKIGISGDSVLKKALSAPESNAGLDLRSGRWVDLPAAGILDPVGVLCASLQTAAEIAAMMLTTERAVLK